MPATRAQAPTGAAKRRHRTRPDKQPPTGRHKSGAGAAAAEARPRYRRVLLKLSGEMLGGKGGFGIAPDKVLQIGREVLSATRAGVETAVVVGGGNIIRGEPRAAGQAAAHRATADYMGMLATMINALALQNILEDLGAKTRVMSAIRAEAVCETYIRRRAQRHLEKGRIVIFAGGTGNPYFSTDTAAALRAMEIKADILLKATKVDGVYSADPEKNKNAKRYSRLSYMQVLRRRLHVMDSAAVSLCMENKMPAMVFGLLPPGNTLRVIRGESIGTLITSK